MTEFRNVLPNRGEFLDMLNGGYIRKQEHPTEPLLIFNYTEKAVYERMWNAATRACRGLIIHSRTYEVVARPFSKFFNYGEPAAAYIGLDEDVTVSDKMDGSLGILYWQPRAQDWAIATRGSFTSDQAKYATGMLSRYDWDSTRVADGTTLLFEVVYPENRIVLDYGDTEGLFLLGSVSVRTGAAYDPPVWCLPSFPRTRPLGRMTLAAALALDPRPNAEGIVVTALDGRRMLKIKQEDYIRLHRIISHLSARTVWEAMVAGSTLRDIKEGVPEEFWGFIDETHGCLTAKLGALIEEAYAAYSGVVLKLDDAFFPGLWSRSAFAAYVKDLRPDLRSLMFLLLDKREIREVVLKKLKPEAVKPFQRGEDIS